nr:hypothetical protein [Pirellulaceae bacterium]
MRGIPLRNRVAVLVITTASVLLTATTASLAQLPVGQPATNQDTAKAAVSEVALVEKGQPKAVIALAPNASVPERTAANELATYLKRLTGAEFAVAKPADAA